VAHSSLKIVGGVVANETPALNEAGISQTQLIRLKPDPKGLTLPEKLGGWSQFYGTQITQTVRALWGWQDTNINKWISYGTTGAAAAPLTYSFNGISNSIVTLNVTWPTGGQPTIGQNISLSGFLPSAWNGSFAITAVTSSTVSFANSAVSVVWTSAGTLTLPANLVVVHCTTNPSTGITTADIATGAPLYFNITPRYGSNNLPVNFSATYNSSTITVTDTLDTTITNYDNVYFGTPISVGGITLSGLYQCSNPSNSSTTYFITAQNVLNIPTAAAYSTVSALAITSASATGGNVTVNVTWPANSQPNPGESITISGLTGGTAPSFSSFAFGSATNGVVTITGTWSAAPPVVGQTVTLSGFSPSAWNGTFAVGAVSGSSGGTGSVSFYNSSVSAIWGTAGTIAFSSPWNGTFTLTATTSGTAVFTNSLVTGSASGSGVISNVGVLPLFSAILNSNLVTVTFPDHGLAVGSTFSVLTPTTVGGIPLLGNYTVASVIANGVYNSCQFTFYAGTSATSTATAFLNYGDVDLIYSYGIGPTTAPAGYGSGGYGSGGYGTGASAPASIGSSITASNWSLDNWGQQLVIVPVGFTFNGYSQFQPIYIFDPTSQQSIATSIPNGPPVNTGAFVAMPQRQIIAWGSTFTGVVDPLLVRWCDVNNYNVWAGQITNQAGSYRLPTGSQIVGAMQGPQQGLLWTDIGLWSMQYIGPPYVYSFNQVAAGCGLIARRAMGALNGIVYWMGNKQFFALSGEGVSPLPCPIWDVVFQDLDLANVSKIVCAVNSLFEEVTWYYPVAGGNGEVSNYIRFNAILNSWDFGILSRTAWLDTTVLGPPIGYDPVNQYIYQHEINTDADGTAMSSNFTTGYFALSDGDNKVFIDEFWPDMKWGYYGQGQGASVQITFNAVDFPGQTPTTYGPFTVTQSTTWFNPRIRARLLSITISSSDLGSFWRLGNMRYRAIPDGRY